MLMDDMMAHKMQSRKPLLLVENMRKERHRKNSSKLTEIGKKREIKEKRLLLWKTAQQKAKSG